MTRRKPTNKHKTRASWPKYCYPNDVVKTSARLSIWRLHYQIKRFSHFYAPNFEKVGDILVSACPYVCMYVCTYVFMFEISS